MKAYIQLIRPKDWAKNMFLFIPVFFAGRIFSADTILHLLGGFLCFSFVASSIYIINDYRDIEDDKIHPVKKTRPLASGTVSKTNALIICILFLIIGFTAAWFIRDKFLFVLVIYFLLNLGYSFGLKSIPILDIIIVAIGFVLRVKAGAVIALIGLSEWLIIMVFLLALFMALAQTQGRCFAETIFRYRHEKGSKRIQPRVYQCGAITYLRSNNCCIFYVHHFP